MDSIVFLLIMASVRTAVSIPQFSRQSYLEFHKVTTTIVNHIPALLTVASSKLDARKCTPILISLVKVYHNELPLLYREASPPILLSTSPANLRRSNANMKYLPQCSVLVYYKLNAGNDILKLDLNWLLEIPGVEFRSFHFLVLGTEPDPELWQNPFIRRLSNVAAIILRDLSSSALHNHITILVPNRHRSEPLYYNCGIMNEKIIKLSSQGISKNDDIFWNKWRDLNGQEIAVAVPPTQSEATFRDCQEGKECLYPVTEIVESVSFMNATPKVFPVSIATGFGRPYPNGSWDSYVGKVMDDVVDFSSPFSPLPHQYGHVFSTKPVMFSKVRFLTPLPIKADTSGIDFLTKPFDKYVWTAIFICIAANTLAMYVVTANSRLHPLRLKIMDWNNWEWIQYLTLRMSNFAFALVDVSVPDRIIEKRRSTTGIRILFAVWFLSVIVLGDLFTSTSISILVEPVYIQPPKTVEQLVKSDFKLNGVLFKALMEKSMPWTKGLKRPLKDFGIDFIGVSIRRCAGLIILIISLCRRFQCLRTVLKDSNACIFVYHWLYLLSPLADLVDASGRQLFLSSEDVTRSYASSFCVSHRNPQLKREQESTSINARLTW